MPIDQPAQTPWTLSTTEFRLQNFSSPPPLAIISGDGKVRINWRRVDEEASDPKSSFHAMALMILTAQPLADDEH